MDKGMLLDRLGATGDERLLLARILDRAQQAQSRNIPAIFTEINGSASAAGSLTMLAATTDSVNAALRKPYLSISFTNSSFWNS